MTKQSQKLGNKGEKLAVKYLEKSKYIILETNYRTNIGEIDIIAQKGDYIIIVEVKTKTNNNFGYAKEMVTKKKQMKLIKLTKQLQIKYPNNYLRIDVIAIDNKNQIEHIKNAVLEII